MRKIFCAVVLYWIVVFGFSVLGVTFFSSCENRPAKTNICDLAEVAIIDIKYNSEGSSYGYIKGMRQGEAMSFKTHGTLIEYIQKNYKYGDTIRCEQPKQIDLIPDIK